MGYPDPKSLRNWAGILDPEPEEDTNPQVPLFNWDDIDLTSPHTEKSSATSYTATIEISMYADEADDKAAQRKALQKFMDISGYPRKDIKYTHLRKKQKNILFSSIKIVYTVEVTSSKEAIMAYYRNLKKRIS